MRDDGDHPGWQRVRLGDLVDNVNDYHDRGSPAVVRYVAGEHIDEGSIVIRRSGVTSDGALPPTFKRRFRAGDVLFHSRNLNKLARPDFDGVTGEKLFVLRVRRPDLLLPEFLPAVLQGAHFREYVNRMWAGSINKFLNQTPLMSYQVDLPPLGKQEKLARLLLSVEVAIDAYQAVRYSVMKATQAYLRMLVDKIETAPTRTIDSICQPKRPLCYGVVQPGPSDSTGVPLIRVCDMEGPEIDHGSLARITPSVDREFARSRVVSGDVLVSIVGTIGRVHVVRREEAGMNIARAIARIAAVDDLLPEFIASYLQQPQMQARLQAAAYETARKTLNLEMLAREVIPVPDKTLQRHWIAVSERAASTILLAEARSQALRSLSSLVIDQEVTPR